MNRVVPVAVVAWLAIGPVLAVKVGTDHDPKISFAGLKTYAWKAKAPAADADPTGQFRKLDRLIRETVDAELDARGYELADGDADFLVSYATVANPAVGAKTYRGEVWTVGWVDIYAQGNLVLEFLARDGKQVVLRGWAEGGIKPEQMDRRVPGAVKKILKRFPPPATPR